ncbi:MAG: carbohydrate ABC transporter permease [Chloroflexi bacterium]|nr:carbohydrate ABC transporter permease [Chloroflexota bacterium]
MRRTARQSTIVYGLLTVSVVFAAFPLYWALLVSFKTPNAIYQQPSLLPDVQTLDNYTTVLVEKGLYRHLWNSLVVASSTMTIAICIASFAAYSLVRLRYRLRDWIGRTILLSYLLPGSLLFVPLYVILAQFGLDDTQRGLVLGYLTQAVPLSTCLMMGYFKGIPADLEEQALVDGCSHPGALVRVLFPLAAPGMMAAGIVTFSLAWDELLFALVFITTEARQTAPVVLSALMASDVYLWGEVMAGAVISSIPIVVLSFVAQRAVGQGLAAGAATN